MTHNSSDELNTGNIFYRVTYYGYKNPDFFQYSLGLMYVTLGSYTNKKLKDDITKFFLSFCSYRVEEILKINKGHHRLIQRWNVLKPL